MTQLAKLAVVVVSAAGLGLPVAAAARPSHIKGCPKPSAADVLCRNRGEVSVTPPGDGVQAIAAKATTKVDYGSQVHVGSRGSAWALFARQATCRVGGRHHVTDLWTRWGDSSPMTGQPPLFWQQHGDTACSFPRKVTSGTRFFCESSGGCPLTVYTDGTHLSDGQARDVVSVGRPQADVRAAQAGTTTVTHIKVIIDFCAGRYRIDYVDHEGTHYQEVDAGNEGGQYVHAEIEETSVETTSNSSSSSSTTTTSADGITTTVTTDSAGTTTTSTTNPDGSTTTTVTERDQDSTSSSSASASGETLSILVASTSDGGMCDAYG